MSINNFKGWSYVRSYSLKNRHLQIVHSSWFAICSHGCIPRVLNKRYLTLFTLYRLFWLPVPKIIYVQKSYVVMKHTDICCVNLLIMRRPTTKNGTTAIKMNKICKDYITTHNRTTFTHIRTSEIDNWKSLGNNSRNDRVKTIAWVFTVIVHCLLLSDMFPKSITEK